MPLRAELDPYLGLGGPCFVCILIEGLTCKHGFEWGSWDPSRGHLGALGNGRGQKGTLHMAQSAGSAAGS